MDGTTELCQLAHLLRVGTGAAREIAAMRPKDAEAIERLVEQALAMAAEIEVIAASTTEGSFITTPLSAPMR